MRDREKPRLDVHGFELVRFAPEVEDIRDPAQLKALYYPQVAALVRRQTGARTVRLFVSFLRGPEARRRMPGAITARAGSVHVDYTEETGPACFRHACADGADDLGVGRRFAIINVWRPITGRMRDHPLALCDARTVDPADLMVTRAISRANRDGLRTPDGALLVGEIYTVAFNPRHRWHYAPDMMPDDSRRDGVARFTPHCDFASPCTPADALPRASVEVRTLAIW